MDELTKIAYNCRKATFLIEKQQIDHITAREKIELKIHLAGCSICRIFQQQSAAINKMVHDLLHTETHQELKMKDDFKNSLKTKIEQELSNRGN
jgi:ribosomal protein S3AE